MITTRELLDNIYNYDSKNGFIKDVHSKQILCDGIRLGLWQVKYEYTTARNNLKKGCKYLFLRECDYDIVENEFLNMLDTKYISNVKILDVEYLGDLELNIN